MKILHVIDALDYNGCARQLTLLAPALAGQGCTIEVCCLGSGGPALEALERAGVTVHTLNWTRWFDPGALWALRALLRERSPDLVHVWRRTALRAVAVAARELLPRVVVSEVLRSGGKLPWYDRWLLKRVRCLTAAGASERVELDGPAWRVVPAAVTASATPPPDVARWPCRIVCVGRLERGHGFRNAVWALDILNCVFPDAHLLLAGQGPEQASLAALAEGLQNRNVHFLGERPDAAGLLASADVCWVPSAGNCGRQVALEALALGRAVVAADVPCLRDVVRDGVTGLLVPPGDVVALARRTRTLLLDAGLRERLGDAARADVAERFDVAGVTSRWHAIYNELVA